MVVSLGQKFSRILEEVLLTVMVDFQGFCIFFILALNYNLYISFWKVCFVLNLNLFLAVLMLSSCCLKNILWKDFDFASQVGAHQTNLCQNQKSQVQNSAV